MTNRDQQQMIKFEPSFVLHKETIGTRTFPTILQAHLV